MKPSPSLLSALVLSIPLLLPTAANADPSDAYHIVRGGQLYDKWFKVSETAVTPEAPNPAYPEDGAYYGKKASDWRCKECHGWDYQGAAGAYGSGKHHTGIKGIAASKDKPLDEIVALLKDETHGFNESTGLTDNDLLDLARFVSHGQLDMSLYINSEDKSVKGDMASGQAAYETICASCHGMDGTLDDQMPPLGQIAISNPWETLHKIVFGQPGSDMPALLAIDTSVSVNILAYIQTLPDKR